MPATSGLLTKPIVFAYRPALRVVAVVTLAHAGALAAACMASLQPWQNIVVVIAVAASLVLHLWQWRVSRPAAGAPVYVLDTRNRWTLHRDGQRPQPLSMLSPCCVLPWLVVIRFRAADGSRFDIVLCEENLGATEFRRLRVRLRFPPGEPGLR